MSTRIQSLKSVLSVDLGHLFSLIVKMRFKEGLHISLKYYFIDWLLSLRLFQLC